MQYSSVNKGGSLRNLIIVSRCLGVDKIRMKTCLMNFHFKGILKGSVVKGLKLEAYGSENYEVGEDYIMYIEMIHLHKKVLWGRVLKARKISEMKISVN